jgi:hypothetical protein
MNAPPTLAGRPKNEVATLFGLERMGADGGEIERWLVG